MNAPLNLTNLANPFSKWFELRAEGDLMDILFSRLDGLYPQKWRSAFQTPDAIENWKITWAEAFEEESITPAMIKSGLKACRTRFEWPPSSAEFIKACFPSLDPLKAYSEALAGLREREKGNVGTWSHPAVYWATITVSAFDLKNQAYSAVKGRWEQALTEQMAKTEWPEIPAAMLALPAPGKADLSRDKAKEMLSDLGASGVLIETWRNQKRWAHKLVEREKAGDKSVNDWELRCAKEVIGKTE